MSGDPTGSAPLVGRDAELAALRVVYERAAAYHAPQVVLLVGNQGTGKTRVLEELAAGLAPAARVYVGTAERGVRGSAIARLLRHRFGIGADESDEAALARVRAVAVEVFADERAGDLAPLVAGMAGVRADPAPMFAALGDAPAELDALARAVLRRFLDRDAGSSPMVLMFDDLHAADDDTLDLVEELGDGLAGAAVVLVCAARAELLVRRPAFAQGAGDTSRIELANLAAPDAERMLGHLLAPAGRLPAELIEDAVAMTGGNPQLLEAWVKLIHQNGSLDISVTPWRLDAARAAQTELPISVEMAIEARIAALASDERDLLEKASIFGNVFWVSGIVAITRLAPGGDGEVAASGPGPGGFADDGERNALLGRIDRLAERDYLLRLPAEDSSIPGDVEVVFKHNLERELVARLIDEARGRRWHRIAAQWLEVKLTDRSEEQLEYLAQLHERGGDARRAALALLAAADKARARFANTAAVDLYGRGLALLDEDDVLPRLDALHNLGSVLVLVGRTAEATQSFQDMLRLAWLFDHPAKGGAAHGRIGRIHRQHGDYDAALACFDEARALFDRAQDRRGVAGALDDIGSVHWMRGNYPTALDHHKQALAIRRTLGDKRSIALSYANIGRVQLDLGAFPAALDRFREALELRRAANDRPGVVDSMVDLAMVHEADGKHEAAQEILGDALKLAREIGDRKAQAHVLGRSGEVHLALGRTDLAADALEKANELVTALGDRLGQAECARTLAEVALVRGNRQEALEHAGRALELAEKIGSRVHVGVARRVLGEVVAAGDLQAGTTDRGEARPRYEGAGELFEGAIKALSEVSNHLELARCYRSYASFCERVGDPAEATRLRLRADEILGRLRGAAAQAGS